MYQPIQYFKQPWHFLFRIFGVLTIIGLAGIVLDLTHVTDGLDVFNNTLLGIIFEVDEDLTPFELLITIISYFKRKP
jgi:hypothetical protein